MKPFPIQYALFSLLLLISGSSYWFLQVRSHTLQVHKSEYANSSQLHQQTKYQQDLSFIHSNTSTNKKVNPNEKEEKVFNEDRELLPDVQLLKFILEKGKEGLPVLRLPSF